MGVHTEQLLQHFLTASNVFAYIFCNIFYAPRTSAT